MKRIGARIVTLSLITPSVAAWVWAIYGISFREFVAIAVTFFTLFITGAALYGHGGDDDHFRR